MATCNCEHESHDGASDHKMFAEINGPAYKAEYVGDVCGDCAGGHMRPYLIDAKKGPHWYTR